MSKLNSVKANQPITISYQGSQNQGHSSPNVPTLFSDRTNELISPVYTHQENVFNDFIPQVLLRTDCP
ncbi:MAG: hypothetical protein IPI30_22630 [Saprospiraceae bacterium]|nr:hypothetical protein [Candidatus Vicinibacter affinis]